MAYIKLRSDFEPWRHVMRVRWATVPTSVMLIKLLTRLVADLTVA